MPLIENYLLGQLAVFILVVARVGGLVAAAPLFGSRAAPMQFRAFLAVAMALLITPIFAGQTPADPTNMLQFGKFVLNETLVGLLLGVGVTILLSGVQLTGQLISQLGGTAISDVFDPNVDENVPVYAQLFYFITFTMFILLDGHRLTTEALLDTYAWLPPGKAIVGQSFVNVLTSLLGQSFQLGVRAAAPAMTALLLATLVLGLIGRTLPQINVLGVGFSVNALLTCGIVFLSIGAVAWAFPQQTVASLGLLRDAVREAADLAKP